MYMLIYDKITGDVLYKISGSQNLEDYCIEVPIEIKKDFESIYLDVAPHDYKNYKVIDGAIVHKDDIPIIE